MKSTCSEHAPFLGADLTDAYARTPRAIDVCGLDDNLHARFWTWTYEGGTHDVEALLPELRAARAAVFDGPQALAKLGATMRVSERLTAAAGKTPDVFPDPKRPFAGFIRTSVELFAALDRAGVAAREHYPGGNWSRLSKSKLPGKKLPEGLAARRRLLESLGVTFPKLLLRDDHLDASLGAVIAAALNGAVPGATVQSVGEPLVRDVNGILREGTILLLSASSSDARAFPAAATRRSSRTR